MHHISIFGDGGQLWRGQAADLSAAHKLAGAQLLSFYDPQLYDHSQILAKLDGVDPQNEMRVIYRHPMQSLTAIIRSEQAQAAADAFTAQMES